MAMENHRQGIFFKPNPYVNSSSGHLTKKGKQEITKLYCEGIKPLSIAVRLEIPHRKIKAYLKKEKFLEYEHVIVGGLSRQWNGT